MSEYKPEDLLQRAEVEARSHKHACYMTSGEGVTREDVEGDDGPTADMLRAGADAMNERDGLLITVDFQKKQFDARCEALAKAEARVKELEQHLENMCKCADDVGVNYFDTDTMDEYVERMQTCTLAARAALQVKP